MKESIVKKLIIISFTCTYLLIFIGASVRASGSGMGCPDWPTCFGKLIPPAKASELPDNYKTIYAQNRQERNKDFAAFLAKIGFREEAQRILNDKTIAVEPTFNPAKTYVEYFNRWMGLITGTSILVLAGTIACFHFENKQRVLLSLAALVTVACQGWLGSFVVSTKLLPWTVTAHLLPTFLLIALLAHLTQLSTGTDVLLNQSTRYLLITSSVVLVVQIALGVYLRQSISANEVAIDPLNSNGILFLVHRSTSWIICTFNLIIALKLLERSLPMAKLFMVASVLPVVSGAIFYFSSFSKIAQPFHLLTATTLFGIQYYLLITSKVPDMPQPK